MKKEYVKPQMEMEEFVPNEYVAVCAVIDVPGLGWVDAVNINATAEYATDYPSDKNPHPTIDLDTPLPIIRGSFEVYNKDGSMNRYDTNDGYNGNPEMFNNKNIYGDGCCREETMYYDGFHYHYNGMTTPHS